MSPPSERGSPLVFIVCVTLIQILGLVSLILVGVWMGKYRGGFAWDGSGHEFNYHPLCMIIALVFLYSEDPTGVEFFVFHQRLKRYMHTDDSRTKNSTPERSEMGQQLPKPMRSISTRGTALEIVKAMIVYRVFRYQNKLLVKLVHFGLQLVAFCTAVVGLKAVFDFHNHNKIPNMYSLHSWLGISTVFLFTAQLVGGFISFLFPKLPDGPRVSYHKVHIFFGVLIFMMAIATCLLGMTEKAFFSIKATYPKFVSEGILINVLGIILVLLATVVLFVVTNSAYRRVETSDEQKALMSSD